VANRPTPGVGLNLRLLALPLVAAGLLVARGPQWARSQEPQSRATSDAQTNRDLQRQLQLLEDAIRESSAALEALDSRIVDVRDRVEKLTQKVESIEVPDPEAKPEEDPSQVEADRQVEFRPPMEQLTAENQLLFVCEEGRFSFIDFDPINERLKEIVVAREEKQVTRKEPFAFDVPNSDFRIEGYVQGSLLTGGFELDAAVVRKAGHPGETWEQIQRPQSRFHAILSSHDPEGGYYLSFAVFPDSYEEFLKARAFAWEERWGKNRNKGYDVGWDAQDTGQRVKLGRGPGIKG